MATETQRAERARAGATQRAERARARETQRAERARADETAKAERRRADETQKAERLRARETQRAERLRADETLKATKGESARVHARAAKAWAIVEHSSREFVRHYRCGAGSATKFTFSLGGETGPKEGAALLCERVVAGLAALKKRDFDGLPSAAAGTALPAADNRDASFLQKAYDTLRATPREILDVLQ